MARFEAPATASFLRQWEAEGHPTMHERGGGELSLNGVRSVDGAVWLQGDPGRLEGSRLILVQTKAVLTSSVLGQALYSARLAEAAGARVERNVVLCGWSDEGARSLAASAPFSVQVEVVENPGVFDPAARGGATKGAPRWTRSERERWLAGLGPVAGIPMYPGATYDTLCAVVPLLDGGSAFLATQESEGMSGLGRALCGWAALRGQHATPHHRVLAVRGGRGDLRDVARAGSPPVLVREVPAGETAADTLRGAGLEPGSAGR